MSTTLPSAPFGPSVSLFVLAPVPAPVSTPVSVLFLSLHFKDVSLETISDVILQTLGFHHFPLDYLKERAPRFVDVTNKSELAIEPEDDVQPITDSKDVKVRKRLECTAKKNVRRNNFCSFIWQALAVGSATFLSSRLPVLVLLSCPGSSTLSLSHLSG